MKIAILIFGLLCASYANGQTVNAFTPSFSKQTFTFAADIAARSAGDIQATTGEFLLFFFSFEIRRKTRKLRCKRYMTVVMSQTEKTAVFDIRACLGSSIEKSVFLAIDRGQTACNLWRQLLRQLVIEIIESLNHLCEQDTPGCAQTATLFSLSQLWTMLKASPPSTYIYHLEAELWMVRIFKDQTARLLHKTTTHSGSVLIVLSFSRQRVDCLAQFPETFFCRSVLCVLQVLVNILNN